MEKQGSAVMRIVAIAVAIAIVFGLASVMFQVTAGAEAADDVVSQLGTIGNYNCIKFKAGQKIDFMTLYNASQSTTYVYGAIFGYNDGRFTSFVNNGVTVRPSSDGAYNDVEFCSKTMYGTWLLGEKSIYDTVYAQFGAYQSSYCSMWIGVKDNEPEIRGLTKLAASAQDFYDANGDTMYLVYTGSDASWGTQEQKDFRDDIINHFTDRDYNDIDTGTSPTAEFVSCKSAPTGYPEGVLWFEDWIKEGMQYPYFSWYIRDNGNHHSYSVKFSYNKSQVELCDQIFNSKFYEETEKVQNDPLAVFKQSGIMLLSARLKTICDKVNLSSRVLSIVWENLSYIDSFTLNSSDMDFTNCENSGNKVYSVCLSDYSDIGRFFIYKADIIDNVTGQVLDTTYFCPLNKFGKGNSGYGSKIYDYGDNGDGMLDDLINNTPSVDPSIKDSFDLSGDVIDNNYGGGSLSDLNISDIASSLESSVNSVSVFFRFCWTLFPSAIWSIILLGLSLIIILRVLGR